MVRRLAIIPARGGSKRIPFKNIRDFCGRPMIGHILQVAKESELFDVIHVSTESQKVKQVIEELGFSADFERPENLADDHTPLVPVLKFVTETYKSLGQEFDQIWLLMPCSPLIEASDLQAGCKLYEDNNCRYAVIAVTDYPSPIERALACDENGVLTPVYPKSMPKRTQDFEKRYYDAGAFDIYSSTDILASEGDNAVDQYSGYILPKFKAIDIDEMDDLVLAEMIYRGYRK